MLEKIIQQCTLLQNDSKLLADYIWKWAVERSSEGRAYENVALLWEVAKHNNTDLPQKILRAVLSIEDFHPLSLFRVVVRTAACDLDISKATCFLQEFIPLAHSANENREFLQSNLIIMLADSRCLFKDAQTMSAALLDEMNWSNDEYDMIIGARIGFSNDEILPYTLTPSIQHWALRIATRDFMDAFVIGNTDIPQHWWAQDLILDNFIQRVRPALKWQWIEHPDKVSKETKNQMEWLAKVFGGQEIPSAHCYNFMRVAKNSQVSDDTISWIQRSLLNCAVGGTGRSAPSLRKI